MVQVYAAVENPWVSWRYVESNWGDLLERTQQHVTLTVQAVLVALLLAVPLALLARASRNLAAAVLGGSAVMYTVPSIALLGMLAPFTGIGRTTVLIALVAYALLVLVRNILVGLDGVPPEVVDAARGLGHSRSGLFLAVELPLAMPAVITGLRLATVTTVALVTVGVVVGYGGLGQLMYRGFSSGYRAEIFTATVLCLAIALVADLLLLLLGRALAPWSRSRAA
ncbi:ABC transporter permease subunit [Georgenia sp. 10Sc9-8]|uniref:ABC transporter permease subunit n=1 Tax=Georgenia halotolerans TaxID=3028317 RepID=A0ABT5U1P5_9MICO|nr:ABC transporter permease subunit [Georgenia halotolerans]